MMERELNKKVLDTIHDKVNETLAETIILETRFIVVVAARKEDDTYELAVTTNAGDDFCGEMLEKAHATWNETQKEKKTPIRNDNDMMFLMALACALTGKNPNEILAEIEAAKAEKENKNAGHA